VTKLTVAFCNFAKSPKTTPFKKYTVTRQSTDALATNLWQYIHYSCMKKL